MTSSFSAREAEIFADQVELCLADGVSHFRFSFENGFLPTIRWSERFLGLVSSIVKQKKTVEMIANRGQEESLRQCGFHLIGDINNSPSTK